MHIKFNKVDGCIIVCDGTRYLILFGPEKYRAIYNRITCLAGLKSVTTYVFYHNSTKIKVNSYDFLPLEKMLTLHNAIIRTVGRFFIVTGREAESKCQPTWLVNKEYLNYTV